MSNPSGTDPDNDPITDVIGIPADALGEPGTGARRYTAPGFDAGSTQIIDRVPDAGEPTELIARLRSRPRTIPGRTGRRRTVRALIALLAVGLTAAAIAGGVIYKRNSDREAAQQAVRSTIDRFDAALKDGDLATLRSVTCGKLHETYVEYDDRTWTDTYSKVMAAKQYPVVASVDEVVVDGDHAEANVTSSMAFEPATTSTHSFDLQRHGDQWKICQSG